MSQRITIREMHANGKSVTEIARTLSIDRKTVYRHLDQDDFSPEPPFAAEKPSKLDPYKTIIDAWLEDDKKAFYKQRHTMARIKERLEDEHDFKCGCSTIQKYARKTRATVHEKAYLELIWDPGIAQVDFGEADCVVEGQCVRCHYPVLSFPYSNMGYVRMFYGETAECIAQGLIAIFHHMGGVPRTIVFDNASGIGRRVNKTMVESDLFSRFRAHYLFEARFCDPAAGWEKGNVERKVAFLGNKLLVPVPNFNDIERFNADLPVRCAFQEKRIHYAKGVLIGSLFPEGIKVLRTLPAKPFRAVRYERHTSDGWGSVCIDATHTYSTTPQSIRTEIIVEVGAHTISVPDIAGEALAVHKRRFGKKRTKGVDPLYTIGLLAKKPGGWKNSAVRSWFPLRTAERMDAYTHKELRRDMKLLAESVEKSGFMSSMEALAHIAQREPDKDVSFFEVGVLAARIENFGLDTRITTGVGLSAYDNAFLGGGLDA